MTFADLDRNQLEEQDIDPRACRAVWCAVIDAQFSLAVDPKLADRPHEVASARRWFGSRDFFMVCALAGLDGNWVLRGVRRQLKIAGVS